ncbi:MAG: ligase-associated DNA damage response DEXH box helicase [Bacteroidetes bacterium]|nr:ligase-associated DNA damage response DEXH box helicase [Bacteroidota bacterium]MDA0903672.1 ligase-associated DNA damage response DEXH box helicase [Bacteroidota bacterium]
MNAYVRSQLHPVLQWFDHRGWSPQPFQLEVWEACVLKRSGLLQAPTGSGKTYAAMAAVMATHRANSPSSGQGGLRLLWVTPLRALSKDIANAAEDMLEGLGLDWRVELRTGDSSTSTKARQRQSLPEVLVTTPESLHVLISQQGGLERLSEVDVVVVDEWHALLGSKRGVQVELALAWLRAMKEVPVWGISATLAQPQRALEALLGPSASRQAVLIQSKQHKHVVLRSAMPRAFERLPWAGHIGLQLMEEVSQIVEKHRSTLVFTNTRRQAEIWYQALLEHRPDWAGLLAMHHGSIAKDLRTWVEDALHEGQLKAVVCTASLDLGVDFLPVDTVIQIGGPKGVSRMMQRAGRSGHRPGATSEVHFVPTHGLELVEAVAMREAIAHHEIEPVEPLVACWDVLMQWLCTLAAGDGFIPEEAWAMVRTTHAYGEVDVEDWQRCLDAISTGGPALRAYSEHRRVTVDESGLWVMRDKIKVRRHRMGMGTIVSSTMVAVQLWGAGLLGHVEEAFVASLNEGDSFVFAGHCVSLVSFQGLIAKVKPSNATNARTPAWMGGRMSLSSELSHRLRWAWDRMADPQAELEPELMRLAPMVQIQAERSHIPRLGEVLVETLQDKDGHHLFMYPFEGRKVHEALASMLAYRLSLLAPQTFNWACNDDGFELLSDQPIVWSTIVEAQLLSHDHVVDDLIAGFNASELVRRKFRDVATIGGLVFQGFPGAQVKERHLLTSTNLLLEVFEDHDPHHLLFRQARDEMLADQLELGRLMLWLQSLSTQTFIHRHLDKPSPLCFPLFVDRLRERLTSEKLEDRLKRMAWS